MSAEFCPAGSFRRSSTLQARQQIVRFAAQTRGTKEADMFTFTPMRNDFRRAAPFALIVAFGLAACGGGYSGGSGSGYGMSTGGGPGSKLFGADSAHMAIGSLANPNPPEGMIPVDRIISGSYTSLSNNIGSLALDSALDYLYVGDGTSILVFYGASMAKGNIFPNRVITGNPAINNTGSLFLDTVNNRLYVGDNIVGVRVFNNASTISGPVASEQLINGNFGGSFLIRGVAVDTSNPSNNILYVSNTVGGSAHQISVFDSADTVNGSSTAPNRTITPTVSNVNLPVAGISLDTASNRLYV